MIRIVLFLFLVCLVTHKRNVDSVGFYYSKTEQKSQTAEALLSYTTKIDYLIIWKNGPHEWGCVPKLVSQYVPEYRYTPP